VDACCATAGYAGAGMVSFVRLSPGLRREGERGAPLLTEWSAGAIVTRITGQGGIMLHPVHPMNAKLWPTHYDTGIEKRKTVKTAKNGRSWEDANVHASQG